MFVCKITTRPTGMVEFFWKLLSNFKLRSLRTYKHEHFLPQQILQHLYNTCKYNMPVPISKNLGCRINKIDTNF